jgi:hypothetical protein
VNSLNFTLFYEIFILWTANNAKNSLSWAFTHFPLSGGLSGDGLFCARKIFCEKANERLFLALFAVHTGKKRFREKV